MNTVMPMYRWDTIPWQHVQRSVFKLQKRIYQASRRGKTARETGLRGADDKRRVGEEPDEGKPSRPVLKPSQEGRPSWLR
jgi:N-terminal domain of reverse transcriptase